MAQILREEMRLDVEVFVVAERSAQLNKEVSVEREAEAGFADDVLLVRLLSEVVQVDAVGVFIDFRLTDGGELPHREQFAWDVVVACDECPDGLAAGKIAEIAQVMVGNEPLRRGQRTDFVDALRVDSDGRGEVRHLDVEVLGEAGEVVADGFAAVQGWV